jgi:cob(I)alamin adenosyltransferase
MKIYTRKGDDGTTGLLYGGRVSKTSGAVVALGSVDEAQAALGVVRAEVEAGSELERDLYVLMAELATAAANRPRLVAGTTLVTAAMVGALEARIDQLAGRYPPLRDFVIPGHDRVSAGLDLARTVIRRAERDVIAAHGEDQWADSHVGAYLNRLSDLVWTMARWQEAGASLLSRRAVPVTDPPAGAPPRGV